MTTHKGIAPIIIVIGIAIVLALGGGAYVATHPEMMKTSVDADATTLEKQKEDHTAADSAVLSGADIHWKFDTKAEINGVPQTLVSVQVGETVHEVGTFAGTCAALGATGGVDGTGLLAGELSAAQCWFAGGGNEIGVFAHEDGGYQIMVGDLDEGSSEVPGVRGNFKIKADVSL